MNFETATATATANMDILQVRPPTTNSTQFNYDEIVAEIMLYVTPYVEQLYVSEDEANELEFYYEHFVLSNYTNFTLLVLRIIDKHNRHRMNDRYRMNVYLGMQKDARFLDEKMDPYEMYANLPNYIVQLCDACERLYGRRHERIYKTLAFMEQTEDKVSPNLNQIIVNKDLGRYLMEFIN
jgi:hypothetical protein